VEVEESIYLSSAVRDRDRAHSLARLKVHDHFSTDSWLKRHSEPTLNAGISSLYRSR